MSAICGIFNRISAPLPPGVLDPVMTALKTYGRDGGQTWLEGPVALGHQMTWVTPESQAEILPYQDREGQLVVTADARLDNRQELGAQFNIVSDLLKRLSDSQLILMAYQKWGADCTTRLLGDFAFAVYDPSQHSLFLARDHLGVKPLYYHINGNWFCFASDLAALLAAPVVTRELNLRYVRSHLEYFRFIHPEQTFYQQTFKVPPASSLHVKSGNTRTTRFWCAEDSPAVNFKQEDQYQQRLAELVEQAVVDRLRSAYPVGSHLSGGLDSSVLTVLAARQLAACGQRLHTYSWSYPPSPEDYPLADERALVETISRQEGTIHAFTEITAGDIFSNFTRDITTRPSETDLYEGIVSRSAEASGLRVLLSGWGGDETAAFNGRGYFADLLRQGHWIKMMRELYLRGRLHEANLWEGLRNNAVLPLVPDWLLRLLRPRSPQLQRPRALPEGMQPEFAARVRAAQPLPRSNLRERGGVRRNQLNLLNYGHLAHRMESWAVNGAQHGLEYRYPLLDRRLVEFCLGVPPDFYFKDGWKRHTFRRMSERLLPPEASWKTDKNEYGYQSNYRELARTAKKSILMLIQNKQAELEASGLVDPDYLLKSLEQITEHNKDGQTDVPISSAVLWMAFIQNY